MDQEHEDLIKKTKYVKDAIPAREKYLFNMGRLIALAESSPLANENSDFLELQKAQLEQDRSELELMKNICSIMKNICSIIESSC